MQKSVILFPVTPHFPYAIKNLFFTYYYVLVEAIKATYLAYNTTNKVTSLQLEPANVMVIRTYHSKIITTRTIHSQGRQNKIGFPILKY